MIRTRATEMLGVRHPIILGGMARATAAELVAAVSMGEDAGLIDAIEPAGALVERLAAEAESTLRTRSRELVG